jgi:type VI protein secretion system component VasK
MPNKNEWQGGLVWLAVIAGVLALSIAFWFILPNPEEIELWVTPTLITLIALAIPGASILLYEMVEEKRRIRKAKRVSTMRRKMKGADIQQG